MDQNLSNNYYYGKEDYDEDDDVYGPYNIDAENFVRQKKENKIDLKELSKGFAATAAVNLNIKKINKSKKKVKEIDKEKEVQHAEFNPRQFEETVEERVTDARTIDSDGRGGAEVASAEYPRLNIESLFGIRSPQVNLRPNFISPQVPYPMFNNLIQQNLVNNLSNQRLIPGNQYMLLGNAPRPPVIQNHIEHVPNNNYSLSSTYNHRLHIVDLLFRFIMQILRTPEPPPIQQIESLKQMLDSLAVPNLFDLPGTMK